MLAAVAAAGFSACNNDGELLFTSGASDALLAGTSTNIVLNKDQLDALVLTIYWDANGDISLSDPRVEAPSGAVTNTVQMSTDADFTNVVEETMASGTYYRQYTCRELNNIASRLGMEGDVKAPFYIRVRSSLGNNVDPKYSNVIAISLTPYFIDMTVGFYLDSSQSDTGRTLSSPNADGIYRGFIGASSWENWWLLEGDNTIWGNDGVSGTPFVLGNSNSGLDIWNFWYPGVTGCYYTIVDTPANEWSALLLPDLKIGGDLDGEMTFDRKGNKWTYTFTVASARTVNITLSTTGKQYNVSTGTDDDSAIATPVAFSGSADNLDFVKGSGSAIAVAVPQAGENTITLDLNNPNCWTLTAAAGGAAEIVTAAPLLYLSGVYGDWTFDWYLKLYDEDNLNYGGALPVDSQWGYRMYTESGAWDNYYSMVDGGTAYEGNIEKNGENNFAAPASGFYLFDVSLGNLTYRLRKITSVSYSGANDDWAGLYDMTATGEVGVYTAEFVKTANTPWGVKVYLNGSWDYYFGGSNGELLLYHDGFDGDNDYPIGSTLILTVNLAKGTYTYTKK